jgi:hypothetical protein
MTELRIVQLAGDQDVACPICGVMILDAEQLADQLSCPHVRFIYANSEAFEYCDPQLEVLLALEEAKADEQDAVFDMWEALKRHCGPGDVILEQTEQAIACGPISFTVWVGISLTISSCPVRA